MLTTTNINAYARIPRQPAPAHRDVGFGSDYDDAAYAGYPRGPAGSSASSDSGGHGAERSKGRGDKGGKGGGSWWNPFSKGSSGKGGEPQVYTRPGGGESGRSDVYTRTPLREPTPSEVLNYEKDQRAVEKEYIDGRVPSFEQASKGVPASALGQVEQTLEGMRNSLNREFEEARAKGKPAESVIAEKEVQGFPPIPAGSELEPETPDPRTHELRRTAAAEAARNVQRERGHRIPTKDEIDETRYKASTGEVDPSERGNREALRRSIESHHRKHGPNARTDRTGPPPGKEIDTATGALVDEGSSPSGGSPSGGGKGGPTDADWDDALSLAGGKF